MSKTIEELEAENARLLTILANAKTAMDEGRYGDLRQLITKGQVKPAMTGSSVIAGPWSK